MSQPAPTPAGNPALEFYNRWSDKTPYATRVIVIGLVVEYILSFFLPFEDYLGNTPQYTILRFEIYRLLCAPFVGNSILTLVLSLMSFPSMGSRLEWSMGTSSFLALMGTLSLATNVLFTLICYALYLMGSRYVLYMGCNGFWTILFSLITIECMQAPDAPRRLLFIPVDIPSKYMPLAMYGIFFLFGGPQLSYAVAILVGYMQSRGLLDRFRPTSYALEELEAADGSLHHVSRSKGWVPAGASSGQDSWIPVNAGEATWANSSGAGGNNQDSASAPMMGHHNTGTVAQPKETFPGTGHRLDSGAGRNSSGLMSMSSAFSGNTSATGGSTASGSVLPSREEIAARRLAALSSSGAYGSTASGANNV